MSGDYLWDRSGPRDPEVVRLEGVLGTLRQSSPPPRWSWPSEPPAAGRSLSFWFAAAGMAATIVLLVGVTWRFRGDSTPGWEVTRVSGAPTITSRPIGERSEWKAGGWLETKGDGRARIAVANIGQVNLDPDSRLALVSTRPGDYRVQLLRGTMHALIWAPPGQFFVETQSSTAVDLGCAYTMNVDGEGVGTVRVTSGWVGFEWHGRESFIPAGAMCITRPGLGPGTPHFEDASERLQSALTILDMNGGSRTDRAAALTRVLADARERDTVTLWHLLTRVDPDERDRVFDRLAQFVTPPAGVTREGIRAGRREMLDEWWDRLGLGTSSWWRTWKQMWKENGSR